MTSKLKQAASFPLKFVKDRLKKETTTTEDLQKDSGRIIEDNGKKIAVYKTKDGQLIKLSPVCTHLGCLVNWNDETKEWDCPCHGSKFSADGKVLKGPASKDLPKITTS